MKRKYLIIAFFCVLFAIISFSAFAEETPEEAKSIVELTSLLILQLSVILFAAKLGNYAFSKLKLPPVLGEIIAGVIIGPYCLGKIPFTGFEYGLFPLGQNFSVSVELYSLATIASIILLFFVGLETDIATFLRYSFAGSIVGVFGVVCSFIVGDFLGIIISPYIAGKSFGFFHPIPLFLGVISTATSVGITARILSEKKKMNSPEGVTILAAAVIDDVLGIIVLAIVLGMAKSGHIGIKQVSIISLKAFGIWLGFTLLGLKFARNLSDVLKKAKDRSTIAVISFGLALLLSGIFEKSGLAMIIGAYVMGLSLSKTDIAFIVQEKLEMLQRFFVPIFFCVMGMLINLDKMASVHVLFFSFIYFVFAVLGKLLGCSIPSLFLNFNLRGALRIGVGMIPRGEVALIIAGIGLSTGLIGDEVFSIAMIMTFATTLITPLVLDKMLDNDKPVLIKEPETPQENESISFGMPSPETAELLLNKVVSAFENEGFFVHRMHGSTDMFQIRKDNIFVILEYNPQELRFDCYKKDAAFIHTLFYEVIAELEYVMKNLQTLTDKTAIGRRIFESEKSDEYAKPSKFNIPSSLALKVNLTGNTKEEILKELVDLLVVSNQLKPSKREEVLKDLLEREVTMSTGMQDGIALPHAKTSAVDKVVVVVGISKKGVDFNSLDNKPSHIFVLTLVSKENPHAYLQSMAAISRFLAKEENRQSMLACNTSMQLFDVLNVQEG